MKSLIVIWVTVVVVGVASVGYIGHVLAESTGPCSGYPNGVCESCTLGQCGGKDATPPDPNRPYFDGCGNEYDYQGNLIAKGNGCQTSQDITAPEPVNTPAPDFEGK